MEDKNIEMQKLEFDAHKVIKDIPSEQANITYKDLSNAITLVDKGDAYLTPLQKETVGKMKFENGCLCISGNPELADIEIQQLVTKEYINELDMSLLRMFYTVILNEFERKGKVGSTIQFYVPDLFKALKIKANQSKEQIRIFIDGINQFKNLIGVIKTHSKGKTYTSYYALLNFNSYDDTTNCISLNAPFLAYVVKEVYERSIKRNSKGEKILDKNGKPERVPSHSYLIKSEIVKERNKSAVENVYIIVNTIEQAGGYNAHISAKTIVERNPLLMQQLEQALPKHRNQLLARIFKKTFELLHTETRLEEVYPNLVIPDANDKNNMPKWKDLESYVYEFPHGKKTTKQDK